MTLTQQIRSALTSTAPVWQRLNAIRKLVGLPAAKRGRRLGSGRITPDQRASNAKARYDRLVAEGRCVVCAGPNDTGNRRCACCNSKRTPKKKGA